MMMIQWNLPVKEHQGIDILCQNPEVSLGVTDEIMKHAPDMLR
jgi:hypothetical protein